VNSSPRSTSSQKGNLGRVRIDTSGRGLSKWPFPFRVLRRWYQRSGLRLVLLECSSIPLRMAAICRSAEWVRRGYTAPSPKGLGEVPAHQSKAHKYAYIRYIQKTQADLPFLSIFDHHLVSQAWRDGWECGVRVGTGQTQEMLCSSDNPDSGNSMPLLTVQQSTTDDRSALPPSQA
jgi:hypothetical protein